jgi:regulator of nucleoside diphosphate kinase
MITRKDRRRLGSLATNEDPRSKPCVIRALDARLEDARYVKSHEIPATVVTMNSTVELLDLQTNECFPTTLVYPDEAELFDDSVSVLESLGLALLGSSVGSVIQCPGDRGTASYKVVSIIHQPEQQLARY